MTEVEMARVETELGIRLPVAFRRLMAEQGYLLRGLTQNLDGVDGPYLAGGTLFEPDEFIRHNMWERGLTGLRRTHGRWWRKYVILQNLVGGQSSLAMPLQGEPKVVMLVDSVTEPLDSGMSLEEFVANALEGYEPVKISDHVAAETRAKEAAVVIAAGEKPFLAHIADDPTDDLRRLVFADWLEENGEGPRAEFIRARVALDGKRPEFGDYADAVERLRACGYTPPTIELPGDFNFYPYDSSLEQWWSDRSDALEGGLPSMAQTEYREDVAAAAERVVEHLPALLATTIRGLDLHDSLSGHATAIFAAATAAARLTRLCLRPLGQVEEPSPVVAALVASPVAANLTRLTLNGGLVDAATVAALVDAPFACLTRLDIIDSFYGRRAELYWQFAAAPWLPRLEWLTSPAPPGAFLPVVMPRLHTLGVYTPREGWLEAMARNAELPALRRLLIHEAVLHGKVSEALAGLRCGELVELSICESALDLEDVATILASPWAWRLELLTLDVYRIDPAVEATVKASPCAKTLRTLTITIK